MPDDNPAENDHSGSDGDKPATEKHDIALAIHALQKKYAATQTDRAKHEQKVLFWTRAAGIGVGIYTMLTASIVAASIYAALQAKSSVKAAQTSAAVAADTERRQLRAYTYVKPPPAGVVDIGAGNAPRAKVAIRNSGQTPAYDLRIRGNLGVGPYPPLPNQTFHEGPYGGSIVLNPETETDTGGEVSVGDKLTQTDIDFIRSGTTGRLYVFGTITYSDAFGAHWYSNYCFAYFGIGPTLTSMNYCGKHNDQN